MVGREELLNGGSIRFGGGEVEGLDEGVGSRKGGE